MSVWLSHVLITSNFPLRYLQEKCKKKRVSFNSIDMCINNLFYRWKTRWIYKAGPELWKASITEQQLHLPNSISISLENRPSLIGIDCTWPCNFLENIGTIWHLPSIIPEQQALLSKNLSMLQMLTSSDFKRKYWSQLKKITFFIQPSVACRINSFLQT